ncbi:Phosphatidyl-N-methylethanolamine N-methyltransferase [Mycena indigotica]|uniref:Phosphatidyl-N-methylethanolamine N-methyltransferase n=1 Tax=Mycena indigotica TaxID=2126181 RepID=A0A8H6VZ05_9AGAR|nr:Phosphatidyl-N-methylethanolamine N-methyltransferase [Mycena indigotica]KAF7299354.1 Phosphatidyl-N-methylethanolamine N-methyltransferase [Mycena indigotica]
MSNIIDAVEHYSALVDLSRPSLYISLVSISASPIVWNIIGRNEYKNHTLTKLIGARTACSILGTAIFLAGLLRDVLYKIALHDQPQYRLPYPIQTILAWIIFGTGNFLVAISYYQLGFYGTFCGDYFGILKEERVTSFPYNWLDNPMYIGAKMCFIGAALWYERPVGLLISLYVHLVYSVALHYEGPFTDMIYSNVKNEKYSQ